MNISHLFRESLLHFSYLLNYIIETLSPVLGILFNCSLMDGFAFIEMAEVTIIWILTWYIYTAREVLIVIINCKNHFRIFSKIYFWFLLFFRVCDIFVDFIKLQLLLNYNTSFFIIIFSHNWINRSQTRLLSQKFETDNHLDLNSLKTIQ